MSKKTPLSQSPRKRLAYDGAQAAPIAVPWSCRKGEPPNRKKLWVSTNCNSSMMNVLTSGLTSDIDRKYLVACCPISCLIDVYKDSMSHVTSIVSESRWSPSNFCKTSPVSLRKEGRVSTRGFRKESIYLHIGSHKPPIPDTIGHPGGLLVSLCTLGNMYRVGVLGSSNSKYFICLGVIIPLSIPPYKNFCNSSLNLLIGLNVSFL